MEYRKPEPITREAVSAALARAEPKELCSVLVDATHSIKDLPWLQMICLQSLAHTSEDVRGVAITCLGHLARLHGHVDIEIVGPALTQLHKEEPKLRGRIRDAVDDIETFAGEHVELFD